MSWDVILLRLERGIPNFNDFGDDFEGQPLGSPADVASVLRKLFPTIDLTDPTWGVLVDDDYSIEFSIGAENPCASVMLHVRGTETAVEHIQRLCERTGWRAFDGNDGHLIDFSDDPARGLREWLAYLRQVAPDAPPRGFALPVEGKGVVFFDSAPAKTTAPSAPKRQWWQFWR